MTDAQFDFQIDEGVAIPTREIQGRERGSQYPIASMKQGQSFFVPLEGKDGATATNRKTGAVVELTPAQDLERQMRQKQSYFSQLGKAENVALTTRTYPDGGDYNPKYAGKAGIAVWHNGPRPVKAAANDVSVHDVGGDNE